MRSRCKPKTKRAPRATPCASAARHDMRDIIAELGPNVSGVRGPRRLQPGVTVDRGGRREADRRSVPVGPGRGAMDRRVRQLLGPCPPRQQGAGSPMGDRARPARMRSSPGPRRDRAGVGPRPVRYTRQAAGLTWAGTSARSRRGAGRLHGRNPGARMSTSPMRRGSKTLRDARHRSGRIRSSRVHGGMRDASSGR